MHFRIFSIFWLSLLASSCSSVTNNIGFSTKDGALYTDDAVILNAAVSRVKREVNSTRDARQLWYLQPRQKIDDGSFGLACMTTRGQPGTCKSFHDCYPLLKVSATGWDSWVMGHYDTCSYISGDNTEIFGICCTEPGNTPPEQETVQTALHRLGAIHHAAPIQVPSSQLTGLPGRFVSAFSPQWQFGQGLNVRQIPDNWPPPIPPLPTHPPDHTAPTHPPSLIAGSPTKPANDEPVTQATTWATKPPVAAGSTEPTTKQTWPPMYPTQPATSACGIKNGAQTYESTYQDEERIVGGHNAELNEWPWIVGLFNNGRQFCGGSLIDDRHVLSAAHCVAHMTSWDVARLTAKLGDHNIRTNSETMHIERKIKRVVRHRGFDMRTLYNDVAVLTLDQPVQFSKTIRPICLPSGGRAYNGLYATVIGWGSLREGGNQPSVLQEVTIPIWTNAECRLKYGAAAPGGIVEHMICAGKDNQDSCSGDSGGPLMVSESGRWTQVGVVSWGIGCGKGQYPGVYTRVTEFLPWIMKNSK